MPSNHPDEPALDVLAAVLGGLPKENRLFRTLMYDRQLAARWRRRIRPTCSPACSRSSSTPSPARSSTSWCRSPTPRSSGSRKTGPTAAEVRKAQNERESELIMGMQSVTRKAAILNEYLDRLGDPLGYQTEIERVFAVTPDDVRRVAREYLGPHFIELDVVPGAPAARAA